MNLLDFIIPAIDLKEGKVVRLHRGDFDQVRTYSPTPARVAEVFERAGFRRIHVVDLDGARGGTPANLDHIRAIRRIFRGRMQVGGGIRTCETARLLFEEGVDMIVVGTVAVRNPEEFERMLSRYPERIILSLDARGGRVSVGGWCEETAFTPAELARLYEPTPIWGYLYTIVERDGSLAGVDPEPYRRIRGLLSKPLLASGGVSSLEDLRRLEGLVDGVVVGKAIYEGKIPVEGFPPV